MRRVPITMAAAYDLGQAVLPALQFVAGAAQKGPHTVDEAVDPRTSTTRQKKSERTRNGRTMPAW